MSSDQPKPYEAEEISMKKFYHHLNEILTKALNQKPDDYLTFFSRVKEAILKEVQQLLYEIISRVISHDQDSLRKVFTSPNLIVISFYNFKLYLQTLNLTIPVQKIFSKKGKIYTTYEEGFVSSEEEGDLIQMQNRSLRQNNIINFDDDLINDLKNEQYEKQIKELQDKIEMRNQTISTMTVGYLKDIQHLKEMFVRKDLYPLEDYFDVSYYDSLNSLDEATQLVLKNKLMEITNQYQKVILSLRENGGFLQKENESLKMIVKNLLHETDLISLVQSIKVYEKDPYRIWRALQDSYGNEYFLNVFDKQKQGYGINYKQIDELIAKNQASARMYQQFRQGIEEQMAQFVETTNKEINLLRQQLQASENFENTQSRNSEVDLIQIKQQIKKNLEEIYKQREQEMVYQHQQQIKYLIEEFTDYDSNHEIMKNMKKTAILKWHMIIKWVKLNSLINDYNQKINQIEEEQHDGDSQKISSKDSQQQQQKQGIFLSKIRFQIDTLSTNSQKKQKQAPSSRGSKSRQEQEDKLRKEFSNLIWVKQEYDNCSKELTSYQEKNFNLQTDLSNVRSELDILKLRFARLQSDYQMQVKKNNYLSLDNQQLENINKYFEKIYQLMLTRLGFKYKEITLKNAKQLISKGDEYIKMFQERLNKIQVNDLSTIKEVLSAYFQGQLAYNKLKENQMADEATLTDIFNLDYTLTFLESEKNEYGDSFQFVLNQKQKESVLIEQKSASSLKSKSKSSLLEVECSITSPMKNSTRRGSTMKGSNFRQEEEMSKQVRQRHSVMNPPMKRLAQIGFSSPRQMFLKKQETKLQSQLDEIMTKQKSEYLDVQKAQQQPLISEQQEKEEKIQEKQTNLKQMNQKRKKYFYVKETQTTLTFDPGYEYNFEQLIEQFKKSKQQFLNEVTAFQQCINQIEVQFSSMKHERIHQNCSKKSSTKNQRLAQMIGEQNVKKLFSNTVNFSRSRTQYSQDKTPKVQKQIPLQEYFLSQNSNRNSKISRQSNRMDLKGLILMNKSNIQ